jgi:hypothetical protein
MPFNKAIPHTSHSVALFQPNTQQRRIHFYCTMLYSSFSDVINKYWNQAMAPSQQNKYENHR